MSDESVPAFRPANPIKGPQYQFIAGATHASTLALLNDIHAKNNAEALTYRKAADAGPVIEGAVAGVLNFCLLSDAPISVIREDVVRLIDGLLPSLEMARAMNAHRGGGNA